MKTYPGSPLPSKFRLSPWIYGAFMAIYLVCAGFLPAVRSTFVDEQGTFRNNGDSNYVQFSVSGGSQRFSFYVASDHGVQAAIFYPNQLQAFISNQGFSAITQFDNNFGVRQVTLAPGIYVVGIRNTGGSDNSWKLELDGFDDYKPTENATFETDVISDARYVSPGQRLTFPFTVTTGKRLTVDGCNSGLKAYVLPADQVGAFSAGQSFNYLSAFPPNGRSAPGYWDLNLPPGGYALAYENDSKKARAVVTSLLRWSATDDTMTLVGNASWSLNGGTAKLNFDALHNRSSKVQICRVRLIYYLDAVPYRGGVVGGELVLNESLSPGQRLGPLSLSIPVKLPSYGKYRTGIKLETWNGSRWVEQDEILFDEPAALGLDTKGKNPNGNNVIAPKKPSSSSTPDPITMGIRFNRNMGNPDVDNDFWNELINTPAFYNLFSPPMPAPLVTRTSTSMTLRWVNVTNPLFTKQQSIDMLRQFSKLANANPQINFAGTYEIIGDTDAQSGSSCPTTTPTLVNLTATSDKSGYIQITGQVGPEGPIAEMTWDIYRSTQPTFSSARMIRRDTGTIQADAWTIRHFPIEPRTRSGGTVMFMDREQVVPGTTYYYWVRVRPHDLQVRTQRTPLEMMPTSPPSVRSPYYWKPCRYLKPSALSNMASGKATAGTGAKVADVNKILTPPVSSGTLNIGYTPGSSGILAAPAPGASAMVAAAASAPPSITNDLSWLTVTPNTSNNTLSIQFAANPGNNPRSGTFLVDGEPITVTQAGQYFPSTTLRPSRQEVDAAAGNFVLDISSNTQWSITNLPDWITADRASGEGNAMVVLRFEANPFNASRSAVIRVNDESLVVSQKGGVLTGTFVGMFDHSAGHISMSVAASGAVTATVMLEFEKVILRGQLQGQLALLTGSRATGEVLTLTVPMVNSSGHAFSATGVAGTLSSPSRNDSATLYWSGAYGVKNPGTWKRGQVFTISIPGWGHAGVANALIDPLGNCRLTGKLPEGTSFAWEGKMAFENRIVFHQIVKRSYHPEGDLVLAGDLSFSNSLGRWTGVIRTKARNSGPETADVAGEPFDPNKYDGHLIFPMTGWGPNAWVGFSPTSIDPKPVDRLIKIGNSGAIQYSPVGKGDLFTFNVDRVAGTFTGSFSARSPLSGGTGYFSGVFLQGSNRGVGFYIGPAGVGGVEVRPLALGTGTFQGSNRLQAVSGQDFDHQVTVPFGVSSYSLQGTLPDGLFFNTSTGAFSGIPTGSGTFYLIVKAHGSGGRQAARLLVLDLQPHLQAQSGTYSGLVGESTPRQETSGKIQITLARNWNFTASMVINGTSHRFRGIIDPVLGTWSGSIPIAVGRQYFVTLSLVDRGASSQINAQVSEPTLGMQSDALLDKHSFERVYDRCPAEGYYTFSTSGLDGYPEMAMGFGTARIQSDGTVLLAGTLGDGTRWTSSTVVVRRPDRLILPFYFNPYANRSGGGVSGEARFLAEENVFASWTPDNMHRGFWWKSPNPRDKFYPSGFTRPLQMTGSIYRQPVSKSPVFSSTSGPLVFTKFAGGTAVEHERSTFQVLGNRLVMPGSDRLSISVDPRTGAFSGTYQPEIGSTRRDRLVGFIDREAQYGFGQWISPSGIHDVIFSGQ